MDVQKHAPGVFCWVDLATTDGEAAKQFYGSLFGWTPNDLPMGNGEFYTILQLGGKVVGALYTDNSGQAPPHWDSYIAVTNADEAAARLKGLGATVLKEPFEVMEAGRMAVLQDPAGAVFLVWQAGQHEGAAIVDEIGALCWNELLTHDTAAAEAFYKSAFGWVAQTHPMGPAGNYTEFSCGGRTIAGMMAITEQMVGVPPHWLPYFQVADCDASAAKAASIGANLLVPATEVPGIRFAVIQDPQGAVFGIVNLVAGA